jgi:hypothetical protein
MELSWPWSYGSWIYNYMCNHCLSPLMLWVRISIRVRCTALCDKVCQWLATGRWFSPGPPVFSPNKTDRHDITELLLKVVLSTIKQTWKLNIVFLYVHIDYHFFWYLFVCTYRLPLFWYLFVCTYRLPLFWYLFVCTYRLPLSWYLFVCTYRLPVILMLTYMYYFTEQKTNNAV